MLPDNLSFLTEKLMRHGRHEYHLAFCGEVKAVHTLHSPAGHVLGITLFCHATTGAALHHTALESLRVIRNGPFAGPYKVGEAKSNQE